MRRTESRQYLAVLSALIVTVLVASGCATTAPGSQTGVVRAEQTRDHATDLVHAFLTLEKAERRTPGTASFLAKPAIHDFAQKLRGANCGIPDDAPDARKLEMLAACPGTAYHALNRLSSAIDAYKLNRTPTGEADMETWFKTVNSILVTVQQYMEGGA